MKSIIGTPRAFYLLYIITIVIFLGDIGCKKDPTSIQPEQNPVQDPDYIPEGAWVTCSPYKWSHDGEPYFGEYCIVYSDCCSYQFKQVVGVFADEKFAEVLNLFDFVDMDDLQYPLDYQKVDVYINRYHPERLAAAWWGTIQVM